MNKKYEPIVIYLCGVFAGCVSATLVIPLEVIRVRQMLVKDQYKGLLNGARAVFKSGGIFAFYEGLNASLLQMGPSVGLSFSVFTLLQPIFLSHLPQRDMEHAPHTASNAARPESVVIASAAAGSAAGFVSKTLTYPFDLAKRRMQISSHVEDVRFNVPSMSKDLKRCHSLIECLIKTYRKDGFRGLYIGWKVTMYKAQLTSVVAFTTYELMCYAIREFHET